MFMCKMNTTVCLNAYFILGWCCIHTALPRSSLNLYKQVYVGDSSTLSIHSDFTLVLVDQRVCFFLLFLLLGEDQQCVITSSDR